MSKRLFAFILIVITVTAGLNNLSCSKSEQPPLPSEVREIEELRQLAVSDPLKLADPLDHRLVRIDAGEFVMGSDSGRADERPQHIVYLDAFEMDRFEITNSQYQRFVKATGHRVPMYWVAGGYPQGQADYPVVGVSWDDADAYCTWVGKRLLTEAEWEKVCRGPATGSGDARNYPWGNTWEPSRANVDVSIQQIRPLGHGEFETSVWDAAAQRLQVTPVSQREIGLRPIGSYLEGASPYGIVDLVGNASEWVADWYNWSDYSKLPTRNPLVTAPPWNHCLRGSPWHDPVGTADWVQQQNRCSARNSAHSSEDPRLGFRCARSAQ